MLSFQGTAKSDQMLPKKKKIEDNSGFFFEDFVRLTAFNSLIGRHWPCVLLPGIDLVINCVLLTIKSIN